jgi:hypothetical protein
MPVTLADPHVSAGLTCTVAFEQVPEEAGLPASMSGVLVKSAERVGQIVQSLRPCFSGP